MAISLLEITLDVTKILIKNYNKDLFLDDKACKEAIKNSLAINQMLTHQVIILEELIKKEQQDA